MRRAVGEAVVIVMVGCATGILNNAFSAKGIPLVGQWRKTYGVPSAGGAHAPTYGNVEINLAKALSLHDEGALFLDARPPDRYAAGHIRGARSVPEEQFDEHLNHVLDEVVGAQAVVTYCRGMECDEAHLLARRLRGAGVGRVFVFAGGFEEWKAAGYPVDEGENGRYEEPAS
jgi:rhodanese-related sulfurtransferase